MEKTIYVSSPLGREWYKVKQCNKRPHGESDIHFSLRQYFSWDVVRYASSAGRRFDEDGRSGADGELSEFMQAAPTGEQVSCNSCHRIVKKQYYAYCSKKQYERQLMHYGDTHSLHYCTDFKQAVNTYAVYL